MAQVKVGDIFVAKWGYDQTNVDFYEVTKVTAKTVTLREIRQTKQGDWYGTAMPHPGDFKGDPIRRTIKAYADDVYVRVDDCAHARPWKGKPEQFTAYA